MIIKIIVSKTFNHQQMQHLQTQTKIYALQKDIIEVIKDFIGSFNSQKTQGRYQTVLKQFFELLEVQKLRSV